MPVRSAINDTITRSSTREGGETVREFDLRSAATVLGAAIGAVFLVFYILAFVPWLLANGMTAAVEGMMNQVGFDNFNAGTLGDWILVLLVGALFTAFITAIVVGILWLYNLISQRTGMGFRFGGELPAGDQPVAIAAPPAKPAPAKRGSTTKRSPTQRTATKRTATKRTSATKSSSATKRRR